MKLEENNINTINGLRDEVINMKTARRLKEETKNLRKKCSRLESAVDALEQYRVRNNGVWENISI